MTASILGMDWATFIRSYAVGTLERPFLVKEQDGEGGEVWRVYAAARSTLVQLVSHKHEPRGWRSLDRALTEISKGLADQGISMPPITVYPNEESVSFAPVDS